MKDRKLILFDWGNVLMNSDLGDYTIYDVNRRVAEEIGVYESIFYRMVKGEGMWINSGKEFDSYLQGFIPEEKIQSFKHEWKRLMRRVPWFEDVLETMSLIDSLGRSDVEMGILSVCSELDTELIKEKTGKYARYFFFSCSMGLSKPDKRIYPLVENILNVKGSNILYFDDLSSSIIEAYKRGWNAICVDGTKSDFIRGKVSEFIGQDLKPNAHLQISRLMTEVYMKEPSVKMPLYHVPGRIGYKEA